MKNEKNVSFLLSFPRFIFRLEKMNEHEHSLYPLVKIIKKKTRTLDKN